MPDAPEITTRTLAEAERVLGIAFTEDERKLVLESGRLPLRLYASLRRVRLENSDPPALRFDPRLPGMQFETAEPPAVRSSGDPGPLPASDEDIAFAPVTRLAGWIESGALSSARLTEIYLERLRRIGPKLECVVALTEERARAAAARADDEIAGGRYRGPLHGVPWGAKDLFDTRGAPTTWGVELHRDRVPERDAEVVRRLDAAGAVLVAKLTLGELAMGDVWFGGDTRSPWSPDRGSGGSSAGPAAATAAGLVGFALGTETYGSITNPCMVCGTVGLRATFGRVPRTGAMALCWSLDKVGPIARSVEDAALVLEAIAGSHDGDPDSVALPFHFDPAARFYPGAPADQPLRGARVGFVPADFEHALVSDAQRATLDTLGRLGAERVEVELPDAPGGLILGILAVESAAAFRDLTLEDLDDTLRQQAAHSWPNAFRSASFFSAVEFVQLQRVRWRLMEAMRERFLGLDAIAAPGMGASLLGITNATGHPALTLRCGFRDDGTPLAVTLHGPLFDEGRLCRIGMALEAALGVAGRRPPLESP